MNWKLSHRVVSRWAGLSANRRVIGAGVVLAMLTTAVVVAAVQSDGVEATNVRLDDGAVWVTNERTGKVGHLNLRIDELDFSIQTSQDTDVLQDFRNVVTASATGGVVKINPITQLVEGKSSVGLDGYQMGGGIALYFDSTSGLLWVTAASAIAAASAPKGADARLEPTARVIITPTGGRRVGGVEVGRVLVFDSTGWWELALDDEFHPLRPAPESSDTDPVTPTATEAVAEPEIDSSDEPEPLADHQVHALVRPVGETTSITAVGPRAVFLDPDGSVYSTEGAIATVPGADPVLQQPGPDSSVVLVASSEGLFSVRIGSSNVEQLSMVTGSAAAPVRVGSCVYAAWSSAEPMYYRRCDGGDAREAKVAPQAAADERLVWRVNGLNVALNQPGSGGVWANHDGELTYAGNWSDLEADPADDAQSDAASDTKRQSERQCNVGGSDAPVAGADEDLGMRPLATVLDVLYNDDDANCEPIAVQSVSPAEGEWGSVSIINNGQHLLVSPSTTLANAAKTTPQVIRFQYVVADSLGHEAAPQDVVITVKDASLGNLPPVLRERADGTQREMKTVVEEGKETSYNVLADWWDPDGDQLRVVAATTLDRGEVTYNPDGTVRFIARGVTAGVQQVDVTVGDGSSTTTETLEVTVKPAGSPLDPLTEPDFVTVTKDASALVRPLLNDSDPNGDTLELQPAWPSNASGYRAQQTSSGVIVTGLVAGSYDLSYNATDGNVATLGHIRLLVTEPSGSNQAPVAVPDRVTVRSGQVMNVDVLSNDIDGDGDPLAAISAVGPSLSADGEVRVTVIDRRLLQIEVLPGTSGIEPTGPFLVNYVVDDGNRDARTAGQSQEQNVGDLQRSTGSVIVTVQPLSVDQPPATNPDTAVVRQGAIVQVPVLQNDLDPDNDRITLTGIREDDAAALENNGDGVAWVSGRNVYFYGGSPGQKVLHYEVTANGRPASGEVRINVTSAPSDNNPDSAPTPPNIVLRAVRGAEVRVPISLIGTDADGDPVSLVATGEVGGAAQGNSVRIDEENPSLAWFKASTGSPSVDSFTYSLMDTFGKVGTGTVHVLVLDNEGLPPVAHDDLMRAKPGRTVTLSLLSNDVSPTDLPLELAELPFLVGGEESELPADPASVTVLDQTLPEGRGRVSVVVPQTGTATEQYRIYDGRSNAAASFRVTADPNAANLPPVAVPHVIKAADVLGRTDVSIDVLAAGDYDPDDVGGALSVSIPATHAATVNGSVVKVVLTLEPQIVLYRLSDTEGGETIGVITVPGLENHPPVLSDEGRDPTARSVEAGATKPITILLSDIVTDPDNDTVVLTDTEVAVAGDQGSVQRLEDGTGFLYTPPAEAQSSLVATVRFEVTDRPEKRPEERQLQGCNCLAPLEVAVAVIGSSPPRVLQPGSVQLPQLDESASFDLAGLVVDDQGDPLTFVLASTSPGGLEVTQNGSVLTLVSRLEGDAAIPVGTTIPLSFTVADQKFPPVEGGVLNITMIATNKGAPGPAVFPEQEAERSVTKQLPNLVQPASNPFAADGRPLLLTTASTDGGANLQCSQQGECTFLSDNVGTFHITYVLKDAVNQTTTGALTVVVRGKPRAPGVPGVQSVGDHEVNLTWTAADPQGSEILRYWVTAVETGAKMSFDGVSGTFTGLTNGETYHFTVVAENALGLGEVSLPSSPAIPDRVPDPPQNLVFTDYGDGQLMIQWEQPSTAADYTVIKKFEISIGGQSIIVDGTVTTQTVTGLSNGTDYTFKMRSQNSATVANGWGAWSGPSAPERPSRYPDPATAVQASNSGDGGTPRLTVTWNAPAFNGGRAVESYEVCRTSDNSCQTISSGLQATFDTNRGTSTQFRVVAINSDVHQPRSQVATSASVTAVGTPDAPTTVQIVSAANGSVTATASGGNNSGCSSVSIQYQLRNNSNNQITGPQGATFSGLTNGVSYSVQARYVLNAGCYQQYSSNWSGWSAPATPYGSLPNPTMAAELSGTSVRWHYTASVGTSGRGPISWSLSGNCSGSGSGNVDSFTGWQDFGYSASVNCTITVSGTGQSLNASAPTSTPNPPSPTVTAGCTAGTYGGIYSPCWFTGSGTNYPPNTRWYLSCSDNTSTFANTQTNVPVVYAARYTDSSGNLSWGGGLCYSANSSRSVTVWTDGSHSDSDPVP